MPQTSESLADRLKTVQEGGPLSPIMVQELLADTSVCRSIAAAYPDIERVILQLTLDTVTEDNKDKVSDIVLSHRRVLSILHLFKLAAEATPDRNN